MCVCTAYVVNPVPLYCVRREEKERDSRRGSSTTLARNLILQVFYKIKSFILSVAMSRKGISKCMQKLMKID